MAKQVPLEWKFPDAYNWIFFSSANGVEYVVKSGISFKHSKVAAVGPATAQALKRHGIEPDFVGQGGDMNQVGQTFNKHYTERTVLFPCSKRSTNRIQNSVAEKNDVLIVEVYDTKIAGVEIAECDIYCLTSPANVEGFLQANGIRKGHYIAIGESTADALRNHGIDPQVAGKPSVDFIIENEII